MRATALAGSPALILLFASPRVLAITMEFIVILFLVEDCFGLSPSLRHHPLSSSMQDMWSHIFHVGIQKGFEKGQKTINSQKIAFLGNRSCPDQITETNSMCTIKIKSIVYINPLFFCSVLRSNSIGIVICFEYSFTVGLDLVKTLTFRKSVLLCPVYWVLVYTTTEVRMQTYINA